MEVSDKVWDLVNNRKETQGFLATCDGEGNVDVACFSSLRLHDRSTMTMSIGNNRTVRNLMQNPKAVFITARGDKISNADGCRVYLRVIELAETGSRYQQAEETAKEMVGPEAAEHVRAFISFEVTETRPLIDMGQGV